MKPDYCRWCGSEKFLFVPNNIVFNPDLNIDEKIDTYVCTACKTIHANNSDFSFMQREIDTNKLLQRTETNITID